MKVAVVGSRGYRPIADVYTYVYALPPGTVVVTGDARGVDAAARHAAEQRGLEVVVFAPLAYVGAAYPDYRRALLNRNRRIAETCDRMVAFWDGISKGTMHAVGCARALGKPTEVHS